MRSSITHAASVFFSIVVVVSFFSDVFVLACFPSFAWLCEHARSNEKAETALSPFRLPSFWIAIKNHSFPSKGQYKKTTTTTTTAAGFLYFWKFSKRPQPTERVFDFRPGQHIDRTRFDGKQCRCSTRQNPVKKKQKKNKTKKNPIASASERSFTFSACFSSDFSVPGSRAGAEVAPNWVNLWEKKTDITGSEYGDRIEEKKISDGWKFVGVFRGSDPIFSGVSLEKNGPLLLQNANMNRKKN